MLDLQEGEDPQRAVDDDQVEIGHAAPEQRVSVTGPTIVFESNASSLVNAGHKVSDAGKRAAEADDMEAKLISVVTPPGSPAVALPAV